MRIVCIGDSNTYGYDPRSYFGDRYSPDSRWVDILANRTGWCLMNDGWNGRTVREFLREHSTQSEYSIIMLGTNDLLQGYTALQTASWMEAALEQFISDPHRILLIAPPSLCTGEWTQNSDCIAQSGELSNLYRSLADKLDIFFLDAAKWNIPICFDGVHFTEKGHREFANILLQELLKLPWV